MYSIKEHFRCIIDAVVSMIYEHDLRFLCSFLIKIDLFLFYYSCNHFLQHLHPNRGSYGTSHSDQTDNICIWIYKLRSEHASEDLNIKHGCCIWEQQGDQQQNKYSIRKYFP